LIGEGDEGVNGAVNVIRNSDLVASDQSKNFNELSWAVQEDESRHVGHNTAELEGVREQVSDHGIGSTAHVGSGNGGGISEVGKGRDKVVGELTGGSFKGLSCISNLLLLNGVLGSGESLKSDNN